MANKSQEQNQLQSAKTPNIPQETAAVAVRQIETSSYSGSLPQAEDLQKYEDTLPGAADRIISMAERQAAHRQEMDRTTQALNRKIIASDSRDSLLGVISAFVLCAAAIVAGVILGLNGKEVSGTILGTAGLASLASTFIYGTRVNAKSGDDKPGE